VDDGDFTQFVEKVPHDLEDDSDEDPDLLLKSVWNWNKVSVTMKIILNWWLVTKSSEQLSYAQWL
jgi:hypothetical protein